MGNDMFNDEQLADAEVRAQASGIILSREAFLRRLHVLADTVAHNDSLLPSEVDLSAHDAALRAEVERLRLGNIRLRSVAESATEVACARTGSISHRCGECRACMVRVRANAALSAPAEEEGRDE